MEPDPSIAWILVAPVKSMALVRLETVDVGPDGIAGDRAFALIDADDRLVNGKRAGRLATIRPTWDPTTRRLRLVLPDGQIADDVVEQGAPVDVWAFGEPRHAYLTEGRWSNALSTWAGRPVRLVEFAPGAAGPGPPRFLLSRGRSRRVIRGRASASAARRPSVERLPSSPRSTLTARPTASASRAGTRIPRSSPRSSRACQ